MGPGAQNGSLSTSEQPSVVHRRAASDAWGFLSTHLEDPAAEEEEEGERQGESGRAGATGRYTPRAVSSNGYAASSPSSAAYGQQHKRDHSRIHARNLSAFFPHPGQAPATGYGNTYTDPHSQATSSNEHEMAMTDIPRATSSPLHSVHGTANGTTAGEGPNEAAAAPKLRRGHHHKHSVSHNFFNGPPSSAGVVAPSSAAAANGSNDARAFSSPAAIQHHHHHQYANDKPPSASVSLIGGVPTPGASAHEQVSWRRAFAYAHCTLALANALALWVLAPQHDALAPAALGYLVAFDGLAVLLSCVVLAPRTHKSAVAERFKRPFGRRRERTLADFALAVFLVFSAVYTLKESVEHVLLLHDEHAPATASTTGQAEVQHAAHGAGAHSHASDAGPLEEAAATPSALIAWLVTLGAVLALVSALVLDAHHSLANALTLSAGVPASDDVYYYAAAGGGGGGGGGPGSSGRATHGSGAPGQISPLVRLARTATGADAVDVRATKQGLASWRALANPYTLVTVSLALACHTSALLSTTSSGNNTAALDKVLALLGALGMLYVACPAGLVCAQCLLQVAPPLGVGAGQSLSSHATDAGARARTRDLAQTLSSATRDLANQPNVLSVGKAHIWSVAVPSPQHSNDARDGEGPTTVVAVELVVSDALRSASERRRLTTYAHRRLARIIKGQGAGEALGVDALDELSAARGGEHDGAASATEPEVTVMLRPAHVDTDEMLVKFRHAGHTHGGSHAGHSHGHSHSHSSSHNSHHH